MKPLSLAVAIELRWAWNPARRPQFLADLTDDSRAQALERSL